MNDATATALLKLLGIPFSITAVKAIQAAYNQGFEDGYNDGNRQSQGG